ncbi:MAG: alpha/beta fold hydrolase [Anaerolineae bacterium]|jgi:pimeloyl-ACP methyl ester carboxylesterase
MSVVLILLGILAALLLGGPFLLPVPPLEGTVPPRELADADSRFMKLRGIDVHYKAAGQGEPLIVLLHGFGASVYSWREVLEPLGQLGTVVAFDRPASGLTERPLQQDWGSGNPYTPDFQAALVVDLIEATGATEAILIGNSAGGTIAVLTALQHPDRVRALVLVDPAVYVGGGAPAFVRPLLRTPQMRHLGPLIARRIRDWGPRLLESAWHNPALITDEIRREYEKPLQVENWDRALWELTAASRPPDLADRFDEITMPVLVITGDDDRIVPTEQSIRLASELPAADLAVLSSCGHVPQEECPAPFLNAVVPFLSNLQVSLPNADPSS